MRKTILLLLFLVSILTSCVCNAGQHFKVTSDEIITECLSNTFNEFEMQKAILRGQLKYTDNTVELTGKVIQVANDNDSPDNLLILFLADDYVFQDDILLNQRHWRKICSATLSRTKENMAIEAGDTIRILTKDLKVVYVNRKEPDTVDHFTGTPLANYSIGGLIICNNAKLLECQKEIKRNLSYDSVSFCKNYIDNISTTTDTFNRIHENNKIFVGSNISITGKVSGIMVNSEGNIQFVIGLDYNDHNSMMIRVIMKNFNEGKRLKDGEFIKITGKISPPSVFEEKTPDGVGRFVCVFIDEAVLAK